MRISYDFRFQATYAEKYFRKTVFLPAPQKELDFNQGELLAVEDQLVLDENMQEIGKLLLEQNSAVVSVQDAAMNSACGGKGRKTYIEDLDSDSDGLSDHFAAAFVPPEEMEDNKGNIRDASRDETEQSATTKQAHKEERVSPLNDQENKSCPPTASSNRPSHNSSTNFANQLQTMSSHSQEELEKKCSTAKQKQNNSKEAKVECNICGTTFTHINSLKQHLMKHSGERPFQCEFCEKTFTRRTTLNIHRRLHTGDRPYHCDECICKFVTKDAKNRHKERVHSERAESKKYTFTCAICNEKFDSKFALQTHKRSLHTEDEKLKASPRKAETDKTKRKRIVVKPRRPLQMVDKDGNPLATVKYCGICQRGFASKWELVAHQECHEVTQLFECDVCQRTLEKKYQLLLHLQTHERAEVLIQKCMQSSSRAAEKNHSDNESNSSHDEDGDSDDDDTPLAERMRRERKRLKGSRESTSKESDHDPTAAASTSKTQSRRARNGKLPATNEWKCKLSKKSYTQSSSLKTHLRSHRSGDRPFNCDHCGKAFSRKGILNIHLRGHSAQLPYQCPLCAGAFTTKHQLTQHVEDHDKEHDTSSAPYACKPCGLSFPAIGEYANHSLKMHVPAKTYQCGICQTKFEEKFKLLFHLELHKIQKNPCKKCGQMFSIKEELLKHIKSQHFDKRNLDYQCPECSEGLYDMRDLKQHLNEVHDVDIKELNACDMCGVNYKSPAEYYKHMHDQHDTISKSCNECGKYFDSRRAFDKHVLMHYT